MRIVRAPCPNRIAWGCYPVAAGACRTHTVPRQAPACPLHGGITLRPLQFPSSDGIRHCRFEQMLAWRTTARYDISCDKRRSYLSPQVQPGAVQSTSNSRVYLSIGINIPVGIRKPWLMPARTCPRCSALQRRSGQLRPYVRPLTRHSPLAIMGVRLRARHRSIYLASSKHKRLHGIA
jgi:hypothetical protein